VKEVQVTWPLEFNEIRGNNVSNTFGIGIRNKGTRSHQGWDFKARVGTPVYAVGSGIIEFVKHDGSIDGYGNQLCQSFCFRGKTYYAFYAHLQTILVCKGDVVDMNKHIGNSGKSGNASLLPEVNDEHLHFEIRDKGSDLEKGLSGRISPLKIYGFCPLHGAIAGSSIITAIN